MTADLTLTSVVSHQRDVHPAVSPDSLNASSSSLLSSIENSSQGQYITRKRSSSDFQFLECIGEGSYSKVYRAISKTNIHTYAVKVLNKQHIHKEKKRKYVTIEKNTLNMLGKHPGIVTLYYTFQDSKSLYFVIDYAQNGELLNLIHKFGSLSLELSQYYTIQLIDAITFIHNKKIIHRDLKPENILLNNDWKLMITDFGAAKFVTDNDDLINPIDNNETLRPDLNNTDQSLDSPCSNNGSFVGTAEYVSPELLRFNQSSFASDFWSLGCIIYQMLIGVPPFKSSNEYETFERIIDLNYSFPDPVKYPIPSNVISIIQNLLVEDPNKRLNSTTIKSHPWFKNVDWNDKYKIWGTVPKLESYNPEKYFKIKKQPILQHQANQNIQLAKQLAVSPFASQRKALSKRTDVDYIKDKPSTVLKKQIIKAQGNTQLMNKVLNNRIDEKNKIITKNLIEQKQDPLSGLQVNRKRGVNNETPTTSPKTITSPMTQKSSPLQIGSSNRNGSNSNSLNSVLTAIDSSKSVIIKPKANTPKTCQPPTFLSNNTVKVEKQNIPENISKNKVLLNPSTTLSSVKTHQFKLKNSASASHLNAVAKFTLTPIPSSKSKQSFIPKRVTSSDAAAAAGAIGTLLTHNRHLNSTSSTSHQYKQLQNHQKQMINPVLLDRQIPSVITSKLMQHETILKLDNIFKSEISHKPNQFKSPTETLNHSILETIINKSDRDLEKDLKSCIMIVTSMARIFIYELNDNFKLRTPQSATQMQAQAFYSKIIEIKLTNKNVSLYDYEFDEEMHEGYLILELSNVNKLIFLSAWDRSRLVKGGINSNVRIGFHFNEGETWVKSFLKAKSILRKRELAMQSSRNSHGNLNHTSPKAAIKNNENIKLGSTSSSVQQSFRKLKINTQRIRSFSSSSKDNNQQHSQTLWVPSVPSSATSEETDSGMHNNSIISGVKELAQGVRSGFKAGILEDKINGADNSSLSSISATTNSNNINGFNIINKKLISKGGKRENKMDTSVNYRKKGDANAALAAATAVGRKN